jgi:hypothetical protein
VFLRGADVTVVPLLNSRKSASIPSLKTVPFSGIFEVTRRLAVYIPSSPTSGHCRGKSPEAWFSAA